MIAASATKMPPSMTSGIRTSRLSKLGFGHIQLSYESFEGKFSGAARRENGERWATAITLYTSTANVEL
jgi:hypothetical protein